MFTVDANKIFSSLILKVVLSLSHREVTDLAVVYGYRIHLSVFKYKCVSDAFC